MFSYTILFAGSDFDQWEDKGEIDLNSFLTVLDNFPWQEQFDQYNANQVGASATISAINSENETVLWVSIGENNGDKQFLIGYVFYKKTSTFLGFGTPKMKKWLDIYLIDNLADTRLLFELFFSNKQIELEEILTAKEQYDSMEARQ